MTIAVQGWFRLDPSLRDAFVASMGDVMARSRAEDGCLEYVVAPDPLDDGRVVLSERWSSQAALDAHLAAFVPPAEPVDVLEREILIQEVGGVRPL